jgi:UDP-sulfoquinovose synthase
MRIYILGVDGYIGWALAQHLVSKGHVVGGCDSLVKRSEARRMGITSAIPVSSFTGREEFFGSIFRGSSIERHRVLDADTLLPRLQVFEPDCIVHLAQLPSAPFSMQDYDNCLHTQTNNISSNLAALWAVKAYNPEVPIVTLGTMGEYGTPNVAIPEGDFELEYRGRKDRCQFPRKPGSFYHASKVASTVNCEFACRAWGLRITDIMQGVVYGTRAPGMVVDRPEGATSFWVDECWGTAINRFCAQAVIGHPITMYGTGQQVRGYLPLEDALQCIELLCSKPPAPGEYRVVNQFDESYSVQELAEHVMQQARELDIGPAEARCVPNPRVEEAEHYYRPDREKLIELGYQPKGDIAGTVRTMLGDLLPHRDRIQELEPHLMPSTQW